MLSPASWDPLPASDATAQRLADLVALIASDKAARLPRHVSRVEMANVCSSGRFHTRQPS
jgi:hypothetical protein